ncbi:MAG: ABC transporter permease [Oscillospiraceae bacterium]|nr:ABC transporter permease [Oscillospiraceae bacterium]
MSKKINTKYLISLMVSIFLAFAVGAVILLCTGHSPLTAYGAMAEGAFSSLRHVGDVLEYAMVLAICGLACDLGSRVGIFNVGGEGQLLIGAIVAAQIGVSLDGTTAWLVIPLAALGAIVSAGLYAMIPGVLKVKLKVNEVITTIMLNTVAASLCQFMAKGPWKSANKTMVSATENLNVRYWFDGLIPGSNLSTAIFAAAIIAFLVWYIMQKTTQGFEMKLTGQNPRFARFSGMRIDRKIIVCMVISGAMCGMVGMFRVYGSEHLFKPSVSNDYYFEGLMVAMIARYQPLATILLSLFFAVLKVGAEGLQQVGVPNQIYLIIQTVVIFFMAAQSGFLECLSVRLQKRKAAGANAPGGPEAEEKGGAEA